MQLPLSHSLFTIKNCKALVMGAKLVYYLVQLGKIGISGFTCIRSAKFFICLLIESLANFTGDIYSCLVNHLSGSSCHPYFTGEFTSPKTPCSTLQAVICLVIVDLLQAILSFWGALRLVMGPICQYLVLKCKMKIQYFNSKAHS